MYLRCDCNHLFLWNHCLLYWWLCCGNEKKVFCTDLVFGCISHGLRIFKDALGVWLGLNSKNRTAGEPGVGWILCKVYPFNLPSKLFLCALNFTISSISQHDHTWGGCSAHCECQTLKPTLCLQVLNTPGGVFPVLPTGIPDNATGDLSPISDAGILCTPCPSGSGRISSHCAAYSFVSFLRHIFLYLEIQNSLLSLKSDVLCTWLRSLATHTGNSGCEELEI